MKNRLPTATVVPDFTPVPRRCKRHDGWTPERQRAFLEALAETGSVLAAANRINMASNGAYYLRSAPGAESFAAAWSAAVDHGVQSLADIAIERARDGVPVPVFYQGEQIGEKRWYNDRLLMFLLKHRIPGTYGTAPLAPGTRNPETIAREAAANCPVCKAQRDKAAEDQAALDDPARGLPEDFKQFLLKTMDLYAKKVATERCERLEGHIVAADFTLRQLTHIELILVAGGQGLKLLDLWTMEGKGTKARQKFADPMSATLDEIRRKTWRERGEPNRPPLPLYAESPGDWIAGGPTATARAKARDAAELRMAEAQQEWEAAQREDSWEEWQRGSRLSEA